MVKRRCYFLLLAALFFLFHAEELKAQDTSVYIQKEFNEVALNQVFEWLEQNYSLNIGYSKLLTENIIISQKFNNTPLVEVFDRLLSNTDLKYKILDEYRVLVGPEELPNQSTKKSKQLTFSGRILDAGDNPLPFANILNLNDSTGGYSDASGFFSINTRSDEAIVWLKISYVGFKDRVVEVRPSMQSLIINLDPSAQQLQAVTVVDLLPAPEAQQVFSSGHSKDLDAFLSLASLGGSNDLFRRLQLDSGVKAYDDFSSRLQVRGSNADENMIVMDGITLYNIDHLYGIFSAVHPGIFEQANIHKNTFPIEYGGRTASVAELQSSDIAESPVKNSIGIDVNMVNALVNVSAGKSVGIMAAGRFTHSDINNASFFKFLTPRTPRFLDNENSRTDEASVLRLLPDFNFYDFYGKIQWKASPGTTISGIIFKGFDKHEFDYSEEFTTSIKRRVVNITEEGNEDIFWENEAYGINVEQQWQKDFKTTVNLSHSGYATSSSDVFTITRKWRMQEQEIFFPLSQKENRIRGARLNVKNEWRPNKDQRLTAGYTFTSDALDFSSLNGNNLEQRGFSWEDRAIRHNIYAEYYQSVGVAFKASAGLNASYYGINNRWYFSPRLQAQAKLSNTIQLKSSWSLYNQFLRQLYHEDVFGNREAMWILAEGLEVIPGVNIPLARSTHFMAGGTWKSESWKLDIELYQIDRQGIIEYALLRPGFDITTTGLNANSNFGFFEGKGQTRGIDVLLKKNSKNYRAWLAYTLSESTVTLPRVNFGNPYPSPEDSRHQLKFINEYQALPQVAFSVSYILATGLPYLDYSQLSSASPKRRLLFYDSFIKRYKDYQRVDVGVNYHLPLSKTFDLDLKFSVFNLFNRSNVKYRQFVFAIPNEELSEVLATELTLLPRIFNIGAQLSF